MGGDLSRGIAARVTIIVANKTVFAFVFIDFPDPLFTERSASPGKRYSRQRGAWTEQFSRVGPSPAPLASEFYLIAPRGEAGASCRRAKQHVFRRIVSFMLRPRDFVLEPPGLRRQRIARQRAHE